MTVDFKKKLLDSSSVVSAIRNGLWIIGALATTTAGFVYVYTSTPFGVFLTAGALVTILAVAGIYGYQRKIRNLRSSLTELQEEVEDLTEKLSVSYETPLGYKIKSLKYTYGFDQRDFSQHFQDCETEIEATRNGASLFEARYSWSGRGRATLNLKSARQILLDNPNMRYQGRTYYYVRFLRPLIIGEKEKILVRHDLVDSDRQMDFQLTKRITEPVESLTLCVIFPEGGPEQADIRALARNSERDDSDIIETLEFDYDASERRASVKIDDPRRGVTYAIEWVWDGYRINQPAIRQRDGHADQDAERP